MSALESIWIPELPAGRPAVLVHGGAGAIPARRHAAHVAGCRQAAEVGFGALQAGGSALDAVVAAVGAMEEDLTFDAGRGAFLNRDGRVELDAAVMRGADLAFGAVGAVTRVRSAVTLARRVLEAGEAAFLVGDGAHAFAREAGVPWIENAVLILERERERWRLCREGVLDAFTADGFGDTVGAVAVDGAGRTAAAGSTGGTPYKRPGRIGDTPLPGAGLLADDRLGAAVASGHGEPILRALLAREVLAGLEAPAGGVASVRAAIASALEGLHARLGAKAGLVLVTPDGRLAAGRTTAAMAVGYRAQGMQRALATI
ncbi:MAG: isoaspartyl peptidase/L-asparaginase [Planctomycetes bacterium]|nr:isoaspartyl peptidase/L-asparaginase [Planctomycetota bacterium]